MFLSVHPKKESRLEHDEANLDEEIDLGGKSYCKVNGNPNSHWIQCAKLDPVVAANVSPATQMEDRTTSPIQNFWPDATI